MIVTISGLIGVGKSSLCSGLKADMKLFEPVESNVYLEDYYKDPAAYALRMQLNLLIKRFESAQLATWHSARGETIVQDRGIEEDFQFLRVQHRQGYIDDRDFALYREYHNVMTSLIPLSDLVLYLDCPNIVDLAMERMAIRARDCEAGVPREYMEALHEAYQELIPLLARKCKVVTINPNQSKEAIVAEAQKAIDERREEIYGCRFNPVYHGGI